MVFFKKLTFLQLLFLCNMDREKVIGEGKKTIYVSKKTI